MAAPKDGKIKTNVRSMIMDECNCSYRLKIIEKDVQIMIMDKSDCS